MKFIYPEFLWALLAIAIPIVIHLFNFRKYKKIYFFNIQFLKNVKEQTNKQSQLKHILVLISRILAIVCLVLAFAKPYFPNGTEELKNENAIVSIYIDNSMSMNAKGQSNTLIYEAKNQAIEIAKSFKESDLFHLVTNDFEGVHQRLVSKQDFIQLVENVQLTPVSRRLNEINSRQLDILGKEDEVQKNQIIISDFQKSSNDFKEIQLDSTIITQLVKLQAESPSNFFIDSVWFESPVRLLNKEEQVFVRIVNNSNENAEVHLEFKINNQIKSFSNVLVNANETQIANLSFVEKNAGVKKGEILISEYPSPDVLYDDSYYFSYVLENKMPILTITSAEGSTSKYISNLFEEDDFFALETQKESNVNYANFSKYGLIVILELQKISSGLQSELRKFVKSGGSLMLIPSDNIDLQSYNELLMSINSPRYSEKIIKSTKVKDINLQHPIFKGIFEKIPVNIDLPEVNQYYKIAISNQNLTDKLLTLNNGDAFLIQNKYENGMTYLFAVSLSNTQSNLAKHSFFVASMLRIAESSGFQFELNYTFNNQQVALKNNEYQSEKIKIRNQEQSLEFIPEVVAAGGILQLGIYQQIRESGNFEILEDENIISAFGMNYDRKESYFDCYTDSEIEELIPSNWNLINSKVIAGNVKNAIETNSSFWRFFILLALLFLAIEVLLLKLIK